MKLTAIVFAKNNEDIIEDCLRSISFCDEIIFIDDYSIDHTVEIAKKYTPKIYQFKNDNSDFSASHNFAMKMAAGDWLLYVDSDERVTPELQKEIKEAIKNLQFSAYKLNRVKIGLGQRMRYGGWSPDYVARLFHKDNLHGWTGKLHESSNVCGPVGQLEGEFLHYSPRNIAAMVEKTNAWSEVEAQNLLNAGHPPMSWWRFFRVMFTEFWRRAIIHQGWRDGIIGIIEIMYQCFSVFITYAKLWEKQNKPHITKAKF